MPAPNDVVSLAVERPAVGGAMIARVDGRVVLVTGAIPGERVQARIDRISRGVVFASTVTVEEPSTDRRTDFVDPACGGCLYGHIAYARQLRLKGEVVADAFARIGRLQLPSQVAVASSREDGYRMRARLHARGGRLGFFREGTHEVCDPRSSSQLLPETCDALERLMASARSLGDLVREVELSENVDATNRVVHVETAQPFDRRALDALTRGNGFTPGPYVVDDLGDQTMPLRLRRHVLAFFQGNRYLIRGLVRHVVEQLTAGSRALDLYAGAGLFSVAAAGLRGVRATAVEGDRYAAADLAANVHGRESGGSGGSGESGGSGGSGGLIEAVASEVESFIANCVRDSRARDAFDAVIVDPPRTGMSKAALDGLLALVVPKLVYVSCDVATLARDSRAIVAAGYRLARVDAFDMFPNTPHIETVVVFERGPHS